MWFIFAANAIILNLENDYTLNEMKMSGKTTHSISQGKYMLILKWNLSSINEVNMKLLYENIISALKALNVSMFPGTI